MSGGLALRSLEASFVGSPLRLKDSLEIPFQGIISAINNSHSTFGYSVTQNYFEMVLKITKLLKYS